MTAIFKYGCPGPRFKPPPLPWSMHAEANFISDEFPHDQPVIHLDPIDGDFVLSLKTRIALAPEQQALADEVKQISRVVTGVNYEAVRLTRKQLTFLRDRINALLETP